MLLKKTLIFVCFKGFTYIMLTPRKDLSSFKTIMLPVSCPHIVPAFLIFQILLKSYFFISQSFYDLDLSGLFTKKKFSALGTVILSFKRVTLKISKSFSLIRIIMLTSFPATSSTQVEKNTSCY